MANSRLLPLLLLAALTACSSVHEAMHDKHPETQNLHLTLVPLGEVAIGKTTPVDAKLTAVKSRALLTQADLITPETDTILLYALDTHFTDFQPIRAKAGKTDGLYHFTFTPHNPGSYRIWAEAAPKDGSFPEYPFVDLGARSLGSPPHDATLQTTQNGVAYTLMLEDALTRFKESTFKISANGTPVTITDIIGIYTDYRTVIHITPEAGKDVVFVPEKEGLVKFFIRVNAGGKETILPFIAPVARD